VCAIRYAQKELTQYHTMLEQSGLLHPEQSRVADQCVETLRTCNDWTLFVMLIEHVACALAVLGQVAEQVVPLPLRQSHCMLVLTQSVCKNRATSGGIWHAQERC
jgi:hypothetical protein